MVGMSREALSELLEQHIRNCDVFTVSNLEDTAYVEITFRNDSISELHLVFYYG
mgnify:CR=1 FL=1